MLISTQWLPSSVCAWRRMRSSSSDQPSFLILGSSWLCHRSLHCLPVPVSKSSQARAHIRTCHHIIAATSGRGAKSHSAPARWAWQDQALLHSGLVSPPAAHYIGVACRGRWTAAGQEVSGYIRRALTSGKIRRDERPPLGPVLPDKTDHDVILFLRPGSFNCRHLSPLSTLLLFGPILRIVQGRLFLVLQPMVHLQSRTCVAHAPRKHRGGPQSSRRHTQKNCSYPAPHRVMRRRVLLAVVHGGHGPQPWAFCTVRVRCQRWAGAVRRCGVARAQAQRLAHAALRSAHGKRERCCALSARRIEATLGTRLRPGAGPQPPGAY